MNVIREFIIESHDWREEICNITAIKAFKPNGDPCLSIESGEEAFDAAVIACLSSERHNAGISSVKGGKILPTLYVPQGYTVKVYR